MVRCVPPFVLFFYRFDLLLYWSCGQWLSAIAFSDFKLREEEKKDLEADVSGLIPDFLRFVI